jgi:hypothetical protein
MSERFESASLGEYYDEAEGESQFEEYEEGFEEDGAEDDSFMTQVVGGSPVIANRADADGFEQVDELSDLGEESWDESDSLEAAVADALEADSSDEFVRRLRRVGRTIGRVARTIAPIARAIPLPQAQAVARVASIAGRLLADGADEMDLLDELTDQFEDGGDLDAAAPVLAALSIRRTMPRVGQLSRTTRQRLVRGVTQATRTLARTQGAQGVRATARILQNVQRSVRQQRIPARALPRAVQQTAARIASNPAAVARLAGRTTTAGRYAHASHCPRCGGTRTLHLRGPVRIIITR